MIRTRVIKLVLVCGGCLLAPVLGMAQEAAQSPYDDITAALTRADAYFAEQ